MPIKTTTENHVATIRIDRPDKLNALDVEHLVDLRRELSLANEDRSVRVIVLTGAGRAFCVGADLGATIDSDHSFVEAFNLSRAEAAERGLYIKLFDLKSLDIKKPLIAAVNGFCLGGGLELALQCDFIIASRNAAFGLPEVAVSSLPAGGGVPSILNAVPRNIAMRLLLTGERIDAARAYDIGLVTELAPEDELEAAVAKVAATIASNGPLAVQLVKMLATEAADMTTAQAFRLSELAWGVLRDSEDRREGRIAFREKRRPVYIGR
ncbi:MULTISPECIES: enoyl-CoA hydratase/isomerase family protein [unclassified Sinorhizobium]|uniref:enoyl-CoA hydratase/isomerase family protein n=1 Tax=unclassified Sinorhizobium TaxID=2613772 RepID=UPI0024C2172E|nr:MULTISPECIES: enoyl-CoA hydratase/isomerase family protein [unclassified Sinorhizobium]MDK1374328.1 enoyl-CoA hydratase/isomerase family protein [Sinorhizobium sp. 6-70]MDK1482191.1 enoyl-CoA hydratase/isomerase family protein [Sinorhizobium sp. 6-117]